MTWDDGMAENDRLLVELERCTVAARLAMHAMEDARRFVIECADTDGDGDCPRCNVRTGFAEAETWRCSREADRLRSDALDALRDALHEAWHYAHTLNEKLRPSVAADTPS